MTSADLLGASRPRYHVTQTSRIRGFLGLLLAVLLVGGVGTAHATTVSAADLTTTPPLQESGRGALLPSRSWVSMDVRVTRRQVMTMRLQTTARSTAARRCQARRTCGYVMVRLNGRTQRTRVRPGATLVRVTLRPGVNRVRVLVRPRAGLSVQLRSASAATLTQPLDPASSPVIHPMAPGVSWAPTSILPNAAPSAPAVPAETPAVDAPAPLPVVTVPATVFAPEATIAPTTAPSASPTATPEVTAAPTATPEVTATPTATPEITATPTASPEITATPTATPEVTATPTATPEVTATPTATATATASPAPTATVQARSWSIIGQERTDYTATEVSSGFDTKVVRLSWKEFEPTDGNWSEGYIAQKANEFATLRAGGLKVTLDIGIQDTPQWTHNYPNSYLVNQFGEQWTKDTDGDNPVDKSDANLIFNPYLRTRGARYIQEVIARFGQYATGIRVGGGRWNELCYPTAATNAHQNTYWAFDALAQADAPDPGWKPGDASPSGQAGRFWSWYVASLNDYAQWQLDTVRASFAGQVILLLPGWGIRPTQAAAAVAGNLSGSTPPELNHEIQRATDMASQIALLSDPLMVAQTTWIDAPWGDDNSDDTQWRPVHYVAHLASINPAGPMTYGENTGGGDASVLSFSISQAEKYGLDGVVWRQENDIIGGNGASFADFQSQIAASKARE